MKKKLLIAYASYGSGHKMAAQYIYDYFNKHQDKYEIRLLDVLDYSSIIAKIDKKFFNLNFKFKTTIPFSFWFNVSNNLVVTKVFHKVLNTLFKSNLKDYIIDFNPDILISTHFMPSYIVSKINKQYNKNTKIITIVTDYVAHAFWIKNHKNEDIFIVSNEIIKKELENNNIPSKKIYPFGIPLSSKFKNLEDKNTVKKRYNITNNKPIFLFLAGGSEGSNYSYSFLKRLLEENLDINIIYVSGKNSKLKNKCNNLIIDEHLKNLKVLGFTNDISNLLNISNVVITKPGGLAVTEAIETKTPMILIPGNGGPENYNLKYVLKNGFGLKAKNPKQLVKRVKKLTQNPKLIKISFSYFYF